MRAHAAVVKAGDDVRLIVVRVQDELYQLVLAAKGESGGNGDGDGSRGDDGRADAQAALGHGLHSAGEGWDELYRGPDEREVATSSPTTPIGVADVTPAWRQVHACMQGEGMCVGRGRVRAAGWGGCAHRARSGGMQWRMLALMGGGRCVVQNV